MSDSVLKLTGIDKSYLKGSSREVEVLRAVDLDLVAGEAVALVAPSGSGKSTLLHIAGLLDTADRGHVQLMAEEMSGASDRRRTEMRRVHVGFVYQFHHLLPEFSAFENVVLPQLANAVDQQAAETRARHLLESLGLAGRADHRPAALSGGEQQRVAMARALANRPALLLADEPTGNLDPETAETVFGALMTLVREEGLTALIATHNLELARRMDRVLRLDQGQLTHQE